MSLTMFDIKLYPEVKSYGKKEHEVYLTQMNENEY